MARRVRPRQPRRPPLAAQHLQLHRLLLPVILVALLLLLPNRYRHGVRRGRRRRGLTPRHLLGRRGRHGGRLRRRRRLLKVGAAERARDPRLEPGVDALGVEGVRAVRQQPEVVGLLERREAHGALQHTPADLVLLDLPVLHDRERGHHRRVQPALPPPGRPGPGRGGRRPLRRGVLGEAALVDVGAEEEQEEEDADGDGDDRGHGAPERRGPRRRRRPGLRHRRRRQSLRHA
uniref:Uncharacterized protein n=1 Tax=Triticum urartu TaxID=4572 RepID=A0A8R7PGV5_TRIUA